MLWEYLLSVLCAVELLVNLSCVTLFKMHVAKFAAFGVSTQKY